MKKITLQDNQTVISKHDLYHLNDKVKRSTQRFNELLIYHQELVDKVLELEKNTMGSLQREFSKVFDTDTQKLIVNNHKAINEAIKHIKGSINLELKERLIQLHKEESNPDNITNFK